MYISTVTKRLVDIDDAALRAVAALAARRRHLDRFRADGLPDLRDSNVMDGAWR